MLIGRRHRGLDPRFPEPEHAHGAAGLLRDGAGRPLLPLRGAACTRGTRVPVAAIVLQGAWAAVIALSGRYEQILNYVVSVDFIWLRPHRPALFVLRRRGERAARSGRPGPPVDHGLFRGGLLRWWSSNTVYRYPVNTLVGLGHPRLRRARLLRCWRRKDGVTSRPAGIRVHGVGQDPFAGPLQPGLERSRRPPARRAARARGRPGAHRPELLRLAAAQDAAGAEGGVRPDQVVAARGRPWPTTSRWRRWPEPGDEVADRAADVRALIVAVARLRARGAALRAGPGRLRLDPDEVASAVTPRTRLIVLTNLHNPSSALVDDGTLQAGGCAGPRGRRPRAGGRGLPRGVTVRRTEPPLGRPPRPGVRGHEQPDQGLRPGRSALRVGAGRARAGSPDVAAQRPLRGRHPPTRRSNLGACPRSSAGRRARARHSGGQP